MNGKSTLVGLLGLGLILAHYFTNPDGKTLANALSFSQPAVPVKDAHPAFVKLFAFLGVVIVASIASSASDGAGSFFLGFFMLLWVMWAMIYFKPSSRIPQLFSQPSNKIGG